MRVLVVDDDIVSLTAQERALRKWGFEVMTVPSGLDAIHVFNQHDPPSLVLLDVLMPDPDGLEVCKFIRSRSFSISPYIIMLTVQTEQEGIIAGLDAGANDYIKKPFDFEELRARVKVGARMIELQNTMATQMSELKSALSNIRRLEGLIPICASCKNVRDDNGYWSQVEQYITEHSNASFTHGICPECATRFVAEHQIEGH